MLKKMTRLFMVASVAAFFASCSSDSHSPSDPLDEESANSSSSVDLDELLGISSEDAVSSSSVQKKQSSSSVRKTSSSSSKKRSSSSSKKDTSSKSSQDPVEISLERSACDAQMGEVELTALDVANAKAVDLFSALNKSDVDQVRAISAEVRPMYAKILKKYPNSCAAQLGFAISNLLDLSNRGEVAEYVDDILAAKDERDRGNPNPLYQTTVAFNISIMNKYASKWNKSITEKTQDIIANDILPTLDSSIIYMQNVVGQDDYKLQVKSDGRIRELDMSETAPALGLLFATKAVLTMIASVNLEFMNKDGYNWIVDADISLMETGAKDAGEAAAIQFMNSTFGKGGMFFVVKNKWTEKWQSIPDLLDSSMRTFRAGLKYSINESYGNSQEYDIYVVGDGADADVSVDDVQDIIAALDIGLNEILEGPYTFKIKDDISLTVDLRKFFKNTKGYEPYLPYYVIEDPYDYSSFYFTDANGQKTASIREYQVMHTIELTEENVKNKIIFPDPTFGGIFPAFRTQDDIWEFLISLEEAF